MFVSGVLSAFSGRYLIYRFFLTRRRLFWMIASPIISKPNNDLFHAASAHLITWNSSPDFKRYHGNLIDSISIDLMLIRWILLSSNQSHFAMMSHLKIKDINFIQVLITC